MTKWYRDTGAESDTVISTRIRLARNIKGLPFPSRMTAKQKQDLNDRVKNAVLENKALGDYKYMDMGRLSVTELSSLVERHLISPEFAKEPQGRGLMLSSDESVSIMICEEDHIRIQVMKAGLALSEGYEIADKIDTYLDSRLTFAFNERLGYLTECPTNLGTGLRASVMLHLPALESCGGVDRLAATVSKIGLTMRGTFGEGTSAKGAMYQLSNQVTLGISERTAIGNLHSITMQTIAQERTARSSFDADALEDAVFRAYGLLKFARSLSSSEFMDLISKVRLGISMGILKSVKMKTAEELIIDASPATMQLNAGKALDAKERDHLRAKIVRERLTE